jgi:hypothetical protein
MGSGNQTELTTNAYFDTGWKYQGAGTVAASRYSQQSGVHYWFNAAAGAANSAITWTQAMTLDASGNLGIGNTSPTTIVDIAKSSSGAGAGGASGFPCLRVINSLATQGDYSTTYNFARIDIKSGNGTVFGDVGTTIRHLLFWYVFRYRNSTSCLLPD